MVLSDEAKSQHSSHASMKRELSRNKVGSSCSLSGLQTDDERAQSKESRCHVRKKPKNENHTMDAVVSYSSFDPMQTENDTEYSERRQPTVSLSSAPHLSQRALFSLDESKQYQAEKLKSYITLPVNEHVLDECPGFFPGCGSDMSCDNCTEANRRHIIEQVHAEDSHQHDLALAARQDAW